MKSGMSNTKVPILVSETDGESDNDIVYVKFPDKNEILRLNSSLEPRRGFVRRLIDVVKDIFLPCGYPNSVSDDYAEYQIWDTVQACASTLTGTLTTKVILQSVGVGNSEASAVGAAVTWILKDGVGMMSRIVFAWIVGSGLDYDCKKWRLFADVINDIAMCIELTVLPFYSEHALHILCLSTSLKALVGVAGGATRAAITQHQAVNQNMADVSAKDGSQETCVNLLTSFLGIGLLSVVADMMVMWYIFIAMTCLHLYANYKAVKCLKFPCFNESRLSLAILDFLITEEVPHHKLINIEESVFVFGGLDAKKLSGHKILIGHSIGDLISSGAVMPFQLKFLTHLYKDRKYIIIMNNKDKRIYIGLVKEHCPADIIEAYFHAILIGVGSMMLKNPNPSQPEDLAKCRLKHNSVLNKLQHVVTSKSQQKLQDQLDFPLVMAIDQFASSYSIKFVAQAQKNGWDLSRTLLPVAKWRTEWREENLDIDAYKLKSS